MIGAMLELVSNSPHPVGEVTPTAVQNVPSIFLFFFSNLAIVSLSIYKIGVAHYLFCYIGARSDPEWL